MSGPGAGAPGTGIGGSGGGLYTPNPRGPSSRSELNLAWQFPVHVEKGSGGEGKTIAVHGRRALSAAEAFAELAGDDRRPLLVLRECFQCNGTDDALMTRNQDNERTLVMSRWFHCVKLPPDVLEEDHPFHALFAQEKPGHLFLARWDGTERKDLNGQQSRTQLWGLLESYLSTAYEQKADSSLKALLALLDRFDRIDLDIRAKKEQMEDLIERGEADSTRWKKLQEKLEDLEAARGRASAEAARLSELKLKQAPQAAGSPAATNPGPV